MRKPPRTRNKMSQLATAELLQPRTCDMCGEEKEVCPENYALSKRAGKSLRDWATTCRQCQAASSGTKKRLPAPKARKTEEPLDDLVAQMYDLPQGVERDRIVEQVKQRFAEYGDDPHAEFRAFIRILKPLIADWREPGPVHDDIIEGLVSDETNVLIMATRNTAKSTLTAIWVTMHVYKFPLKDILVVSKSSGLAKRMLRTVRAWIGACPLLVHLVPGDDDLDSAEEFNVAPAHGKNTGGSTMVSLGLTSQLTGRRAHVVICDDIEGPDDNTPEKVAALEERQNEIEHVCHPGGRKITLGTPQSEYSLYAQQAVGGVWRLYKALMFEVLVDENGKQAFSSRWPTRFTDEELLKKKRSMTKRQWDLHWMLICDPKKLLEKPLKIQDLVLVSWDPKRLEFPLTVAPGSVTHHKVSDVPTWGVPEGDVWIGPADVSTTISPYAVTIAAVDPASGLAGRDAIGLAIISVTQSGQAVIRHVEGVRGKTLEANMARLAEVIRDHTCHRLVVEEKANSLFGKTLCDELIKRGWPMTHEAVNAGQMSKGARIIDALAPPMAAGRVIMLEEVARSDDGGELVNQMVSCSYDGRIGAKFDDIVDALAHAVNSAGEALTGDRLEGIIAAKQNVEALYDVPMREGGIRAGDITEALHEKSVALQKLEDRLTHFLEVRDKDAARGRHDPWVNNKIQTLSKKIELVRKQEAKVA